MQKKHKDGLTNYMNSKQKNKNKEWNKNNP